MNDNTSDETTDKRHLYSNLTSSPMSAQSWIVDNISSIIGSNHDDDLTSEANLSNDCTLTAAYAADESNRLNTPLASSRMTFHNEDVEVARAFQNSPPYQVTAKPPVAITSQLYSPPNQFPNQQDFYNQFLQQSFLNQQTHQPQHLPQMYQPQLNFDSNVNSHKRNIRTSDTNRIPVSSSSYSLNNYLCEDSTNYEHQFMKQFNHHHLQPSVSTSAINSYSLLNEDSSSSTAKKKKLTNFSSASSIHQYQNPAAASSFTYSSSSYSNFSSSNSELNELTSPSSSLAPSANTNLKQGNMNSKLIKSLSGTHLLPGGMSNMNSSSSTPSLNQFLNAKEYGLFSDTNSYFGNTDLSSSYYRELSQGLDVAAEDAALSQPCHLKSSQSNYSFNNTAIKSRLTKSSTTSCFNKENANNSNTTASLTANIYNNNNQFFSHSNSFDNMRLLNVNSVSSSKTTTKEANPSTKTQSYSTANSSVNNMSTSVSNTSLNASCAASKSSSDHIVLHVRNLDYKISADEWKRILSENFRKHCKEIISVNVVTNADKSLLGIVKLATKEEARLAISCLHHKKIGYKRLNVNIANQVTSNSPKSKVVALLKSAEANELPLSRFMELYEQRYNQTIGVSELLKLKDIVHVSSNKDGLGRHIKLTTRNYNSNLDAEIQDLLQTPYCSLHSNQSNSWLPNVIVSLRTFKSAVHKLLNDHGGQMPLLSFMDCYKCCIFNETSQSSTNPQQANKLKDSSYQLVIDNESGVPLEHLITCAQDVQIQYNEGFYKQLQWENDKSKPHNLQSRNGNTISQQQQQQQKQRSSSLTSLEEDYLLDDESLLDDSQRKLSQFMHELVELCRSMPRCLLPLSKFNNEYTKLFGKQCRVADYGFTKLYELLESMPHICQILDAEYEKKLTLTHRVQVKLFSTDLVRVLKASQHKQMFADDYPHAYEEYFSKQFDISDFGVCFLEDMLAELPESIVCRKEIDSRTFIQLARHQIVSSQQQQDEDRVNTWRLVYDIIEMLKFQPKFSIQLCKFIPHYRHHFGRQFKLSSYGFTRLVELFDSIPETVHVIQRDGLQFVQLNANLMLELICANLVKYLDENNFKIKISLRKLEEIYNLKFEPICYADFGCENFIQLFSRLPLRTSYISVKPATSQIADHALDSIDWMIECESLDVKVTRRCARFMLKKLIDESEELLTACVKSHKWLSFQHVFEMLAVNNCEVKCKQYNARSMNSISKCIREFFVYANASRVFMREDEWQIVGLSELFYFAKQVRFIFKSSSLIDMTVPELEAFYKKIFLNGKSGLVKSLPVNEQLFLQQQQAAVAGGGGGGVGQQSVIPFRRLGFTDLNLLLAQGLCLIVSVKKYTDKRICINREFWPKTMIESSTQMFMHSPSSSPVERDPVIQHAATSLTPLSNRYVLADTSNHHNHQQRNIFASSQLYADSAASSNGNGMLAGYDYCNSDYF